MEINTPRKKILVDFIREIWNEGRFERAGAYLAPSYTLFHDPGDPWHHQTLDLAGYQERVRLSRAPFPDQTFEIQDIFEDGDAVVISWFWNATHLADMPGFPATGKPLKMSGITIYYFEGERIRGHWQMTDRLGVYQQLRLAAGG